MVDKDTANYKEGTVRDAIADFRKTLAVEYSTRNRFELLNHIMANNPNEKTGEWVAIATIRRDVALKALEKLLWDARKSD